MTKKEASHCGMKTLSERIATRLIEEDGSLNDIRELLVEEFEKVLNNVTNVGLLPMQIYNALCNTYPQREYCLSYTCNAIYNEIVAYKKENSSVWESDKYE